jgi:antitoxin component of RelBE/YafQ-DinJ toxin-antitoxin module
MDAKITLSFDESVIEKAKAFAASQGMSLSRLTEFLFEKITSSSKSYSYLDDIPVASFVNMVAEEQAEYITAAKSSKSHKDEFYKSRK